MTQITRTLDEYFPEVDLPEQPLQDWAIVQLKKNFEEDKTSGGIIIPGIKAFDEKGQSDWHETMAKVIAIGPVFQCNRETLEPWPECANTLFTVRVGDVIRIPEHLAGRFTVRAKNGDDIKCISIRDTQIMRKIIDPMASIARVTSYVSITERRL